MIKRLCAIMLVLSVCIPVTVFAEESPCIFFAPQSMNEDNEILVPVYTKNLPQDNDGLCGIEFKFAYDTEHFMLKTNKNNGLLLETSTAMLVQDTDIAEVSVSEDIVSVNYIDFGAEDNVVLRDGPLFYFTLIPKNPDALWNSDDYYPLRFIPDSINLIVLDKENYSLKGIPAEGIDTYVGGYNTFPTFEIPKIEDKIEFKNGISAVYINGGEKATDAPPYIKDEFMIPLRPLAEAVGMEISWDSKTKMVSVFYPYISAYFDMSKEDTYINAKLRTDLPKPEIINGRTFVPVSTIRAMFADVLNIENNGDSISLDFNKKEEE